jgi:hypothetical protein
MSPSLARLLAVALAVALASPAALAARFVYEGRLDDAGQPANGRYDLKLTAYGHAAQGATLAAPVTFEGVEVRDGRFRLDVDLPLVKADQVWLEVAVRGAGEPAFAEIPGRAKAIAAPLIGACWSTTGDSGSNPATNFIGTTDAQAFVVRTQNVQSLRIEPSMVLFGGNPITANVIAGSSANFVTAGVRGATIAGGGVPAGDSDPNFVNEAPNRVTDAYGTVGGGLGNRAGDDTGTTIDRPFATVGGGVSNIASGQLSTVAGGERNTASREGSTVGGGNENTASGSFSVVSGGQFNAASGNGSVVVGGVWNSASGLSGTVGGGASNCAGGELSWAGGNRAKVRPGSASGDPGQGCLGIPTTGTLGDRGTFVWADIQGSDFVSTGSNQFLVRAAGGAAINHNDPAGNALRVAGTLRVDSLGTAAATTLCRNASNQISSCSSSARYKQDIADLELGLATALRLHAVGYRWKDGGEADIGFVAEEIAAIDERLVTRNEKGEVEGVKYERLTAVLANAVQELAARESLAAESIARVRDENAALRAGQDRLSRDNAALRARLDRLESLLGARLAEGR